MIIGGQRLSQHREVLGAPSAGEGLRDLRGGALAALVTMLGQEGGIALAGDDGADDCHTGGAGNVGEHAVELEVHLGQGLLHALHVSRPHPR